METTLRPAVESDAAKFLDRGRFFLSHFTENTARRIFKDEYIQSSKINCCGFLPVLILPCINGQSVKR